MKQDSVDTFLDAVLSMRQEINHIIEYMGRVCGVFVGDLKIG